jgi:hypothetical protein
VTAIRSPIGLGALIGVAAERHGGASGRRLAEIAQRGGHRISHATLNRLRQGTYTTRPTNTSIEAIAYLAAVPESEVYAAAGLHAPSAVDYQLPATAQCMSDRQRKALDELVKAFVDERAPHAAPAETVDGEAFVHLARMALQGKDIDVATYIRRQAHRYRTSSPRTALALRALLAAVAPPTPLRTEHSAAM